MMLESIYSKGLCPIRNVFLNNNDLFALVANEGWLFGRVLYRKFLLYKPYRVINEDGNPLNINPSSSTPAITLRDTRDSSKKILYIQDPLIAGLPVLLHGGIGITPQQVRMYPQYGKGQYYGDFPNLSFANSDNGDDISYIDSTISPYEEPTNAIEYVITPQKDAYFSFYNKEAAGGAVHRPMLNIQFMLYFVQFFKPSDPRYHTLIKNIVLKVHEGANAKILVNGFLGGAAYLESIGALTLDRWNMRNEVLSSLDEALQL